MDPAGGERRRHGENTAILATGAETRWLEARRFEGMSGRQSGMQCVPPLKGAKSPLCYAGRHVCPPR